MTDPSSRQWRYQETVDGSGFLILRGEEAMFGASPYRYETERNVATLNQLESALAAVMAAKEEAEAEVARLKASEAGTWRARANWIWTQIHERQDRWADLVGYWGGESMRTPEQAFFEAWDEREQSLATAREGLEKIIGLHNPVSYEQHRMAAVARDTLASLDRK